jgi:hypothetical protein
MHRDSQSPTGTARCRANQECMSFHRQINQQAVCRCELREDVWAGFPQLTTIAE